MIEVSIIIVKFKAPKILKRCLEAIPKLPSIETIIVDNDQLNRGFAKGVNLGAKRARGKYLLLLNPDCVLNHKSINFLVKLLKDNPKVGICGPQLRGDDGKPYLSFTKQPTKVSAMVVYSCLNKWFPNNRFSREYWYKDKSLQQVCEVESISGAAMLVRKKEFLDMGGMDERFFMYWEDYDLCKRFRSMGRKILFEPKATVIHSREASTDRDSYQTKRFFRQSRFRFFRKYFKLPAALGINIWLIAQEEWQILAIIITSISLRFWFLPEMMPLLGDQGRDFLAARDALENRQIPLLGIESSVPRFAQGPLYVWLLMVLRVIFGGDPVIAGIVGALTGVITIGLVYLLFYRFFNRQVAIVSCLILATSPLAVAQSRLAFMTNPIPLASIFYLYCLFKPYTNWRNLFWVLFSFLILFQFELAVLPLAGLVIWYAWQYHTSIRKTWKKALMGMVAAVALGLWPQIIFDITHGFRQLGLFGVWVIYRIAAFAGFDPEHAVSSDKLVGFQEHLYTYLSRFFVWGKPTLSMFYLAIMGFGVCVAVLMAKKRKLLQPEIILWLWLGLLVVGFMIHSAPSEAYFPVLFLPLSGLISWSVSKMKRPFEKGVTGLVILIAIYNTWFIFNRDFMMTTPKNTALGYQFPYGTPLKLQKQLINTLDIADNQSIRFEFNGEGKTIPHFMDGYTYLAKERGVKVTLQGRVIQMYFDKINNPKFKVESDYDK